MKLKQPVVITGLCRTPIGRLAGVLAPVEPHVLLGAALRETLSRACKFSTPTNQSASAPCSMEELDADLVPADVIVGNVRNSIGNIARVGALEAGLPPSVPAQTVDRQCASSMEALSQAAARIGAGLGECYLVGGVESASQAPWLYAKTSRPYSYFEPQPFKVRMATEAAGDPPMGETAEILADEFGISREEMDAFAAESHDKAARATRDGAFDSEIVALPNPDRKAVEKEVLLDECIRADTTPEVLAKLRPVFRKDGRVTAGNSSPLNDGAVGGLMLSEARASALGVSPRARLIGITTVGLDPKRMGLGPALAIPALLKSCGMGVGDIDLFEINEAFAAQVLACLKQLEADGCAIPAEKLNVNGGAIALGHPLGATGLRLVVTLVHALRARGLKRGVASLCVGGGQGMAVLVETAR